jgi:SAM-dependent methyltransferase
MPNPQSWKPSKAELWNGRWRASRNPSEISYGSRIIGDLEIEAYARQIRAHATGVLADVGCGKAPYFGIYRDLVTKSVGVDWGSSLHPSDQVEIVCDLNESIALPDEFADTVLCTDVMEHLFEPGKIWAEIARILVPGGKAIIGVPFLYWIHEAPYDYHRYTSFALRRYAEKSGLEIASLEAVGGPLHVLADLTCKLVRPWPLKVLAGQVWSAGLSILTRNKVSADTGFPLHYVLVAVKPR